MAGINKVIVLGNVGREPETRTVPSNNQAFTTISVATSESWSDRNTNEKKELTEWHRVVFWGKNAERARDYIKKGSQVYVEGKLKTRKYTDKEGVERFTTEIVADLFQLVGPKPTEGNATQQPQPQAEPTLENAPDDVPF